VPLDLLRWVVPSSFEPRAISQPLCFTPSLPPIPSSRQLSPSPVRWCAQMCRQRGQTCGACHSSERLFVFERRIVCQCEGCGNYFHRSDPPASGVRALGEGHMEMSVPCATPYDWQSAHHSHTPFGGNPCYHVHLPGNATARISVPSVTPKPFRPHRPSSRRRLLNHLRRLRRHNERNSPRFESLHSPLTVPPPILLSEVAVVVFKISSLPAARSFWESRCEYANDKKSRNEI